MLTPRFWTEVIAKVLFKIFEVSDIYYLIQNSLPLYVTGEVLAQVVTMTSLG